MSPRGDDRAAVLALAALPEMTPTRLVLVVGAGHPGETLAALAEGRPAALARLAANLGRGGDDVLAAWRRAAADVDPGRLWRAHLDAGLRVATVGDDDWPAERLAGLRAPPLVLCARGDPTPWGATRVAIVGTRSCTRYGLDVARRLGRDLAAAGVGVVSGLALGIDGAAHEGALSVGGAPPLAVVAGGLDRPYPRQHLELWRRVTEAGAVVTEVPLGTAPLPWRFPARNRLIAALSDVTVVVESHARGGSLTTAEAAESLQRPVLAVPGPVDRPASAGTNDLLADRAHVCRGVEDVLAVVGLGGGTRGAVAPEVAPAARPEGVGGQLLGVLDADAATVDQLVLRTGLELDEVVVSLGRLVAAGWAIEQGGWYEATSPSC